MYFQTGVRSPQRHGQRGGPHCVRPSGGGGAGPALPQGVLPVPGLPNVDAEREINMLLLLTSFIFHP